MRKCCDTCNSCVEIKFTTQTKYSYCENSPENRIRLVCIFAPPCGRFQGIPDSVIKGKEKLGKYAYYPIVTNSAPCKCYVKQSEKKIRAYEKMLAKEKSKKLQKAKKKKEEVEAAREERKKAIAFRKAAKEREKKEKLKRKKRLEYQKEYRLKKKFFSAQQKEEENEFNRFEMLDIKDEAEVV